MGFKVVVFSAEEEYPNEIEQLIELFKNGMEQFHLRKPFASSDYLRSYLSSIPVKFHSKIFVHYDKKVASEFDCKLHLQYKFANIYGEVQPCDSVSVHSLEEFKAIDSKIEYCTLSPIFESISKENYEANPTLRKIPTERKTKLIALGGIDDSTIERAKDFGFDGAASIGAIWHNGQKPLENFLKLKQISEQITETC